MILNKFQNSLQTPASICYLRQIKFILKKENIYIVPLLYYINFQVHNLKILICNFLKRIVCVTVQKITKKNEDKWKAIDRMSGLILLPALHETDPNMVNNTVKGKIYSPESSDGEEDLP